MFYMGQVVDTLYDVCIEIQKDGIKILDKYFIMNIFDDVGKDTPELKNVQKNGQRPRLQHHCCQKQQP